MMVLVIRALGSLGGEPKLGAPLLRHSILQLVDGLLPFNVILEGPFSAGGAPDFWTVVLGDELLCALVAEGMTALESARLPYVEVVRLIADFARQTLTGHVYPIG